MSWVELNWELIHYWKLAAQIPNLEAITEASREDSEEENIPSDETEKVTEEEHIHKDKNNENHVEIKTLK